MWSPQGSARRTTKGVVVFVRRPTLYLLVLAALIAGVFASAAGAATVSYTGSLSAASPTYNRPASTVPEHACGYFPGLSDKGTSVFYDAHSFTVDAAGTYDIANTSNTFPGGDGFFALYQGSFDPANPLTNLLYVDDESGPGSQPEIICPLAAGTTYILVTSTYFNDDTGNFTNSITGPLLPPPVTMIEDLQTLVSGMALSQGLTTALNSKLQEALDDLAADDSAGVCDSLQAFLNQVKAQTGKKLNEAQAQQLTDSANEIRTQLAC